MMSFRLIKKLYSNTLAFGFSKCFSQSSVEVVSKEVKYPPILDATPEGLLRNERQNFYDHVQSLPTVIEKQHAITSWPDPTTPVYTMSSAALNSNCINFQQYVTRTHLIRGLPQEHQETDVDRIFSELEPHLHRIIASQLNNQWRSGKNLAQRVYQEVISLLYRRMAFEYDFLFDSTLDTKPRIDSYWWHGDFVSEDNKLEEKNLCFQYSDHPEYALRVKTPLKPVVPLDDPLCASGDVPNYNYHPSCFDVPHKTRNYITSVPGFWPGDPCEFPFISFHSTETLSEQIQSLDPTMTLSEIKAKLDNIGTSSLPTFEEGLGIMSSFGQLMATATNQGFTPFHDVTYPLVTQTVLSDGQEWHFFIYQLNTMCFHSDMDLKNKRNICWSSEKMRLFETIENGELKGVDNTVFKEIIRFFVNVPQIPKGVELKPYLSTPTKSPEEFEVIKKELLKMFSNRFDPNAHKYEIPLWVRIYKMHPDAPPTPRIYLK